jgi:hypothetical protein
MEWLIGIGIILIVIFFLTRSKTTDVEVEDFIEEGKIYTPAEAVHTIQKFIVALNGANGYWSTFIQDVQKEFPRSLRELKKDYKEQLREIKSEMTETNNFYKDEIKDLKADADLNKDELKEKITEEKGNCSEQLEPLKRSAEWYEKQISGIDENPIQLLKQTLELIKREKNNDYPPDITHFFHELARKSPRSD